MVYWHGPRDFPYSRKNKQINFAWTPPPHYSFTDFLSLSQFEYINPVPAERIFGKTKFENIYINMYTNSNLFCNPTKTSDNLHKESTVLAVMYFSTIQTINNGWITVRKLVTRTRQKFFDLCIFPVFNNILHCTLM